MAALTINLPESNSPDGVTLETLEAYVLARGNKSVEEFVNLIIADALGFRSVPVPDSPAFAQLRQLRDRQGNSE